MLSRKKKTGRKHYLLKFSLKPPKIARHNQMATPSRMFVICLFINRNAGLLRPPDGHVILPQNIQKQLTEKKILIKI